MSDGREKKVRPFPLSIPRVGPFNQLHSNLMATPFTVVHEEL